MGTTENIRPFNLRILNRANANLLFQCVDPLFEEKFVCDSVNRALRFVGQQRFSGIPNES